MAKVGRPRKAANTEQLVQPTVQQTGRRTRQAARAETTDLPTVGEEELHVQDRLERMEDAISNIDRRFDELVESMRDRRPAWVNSLERNDEQINLRGRGRDQDFLSDVPISPTRSQTGTVPKSKKSIHHWQWVEKGVIESIMSLEFDPDDLWKLLPQEERKAKTKEFELENTDGIIVNFTKDGPSKIVSGKGSKCEKILSSFHIWFRAFGTYVAIRTLYDPSGAYAPAFATFMVNISSENVTYSWPACFSYAQSFLRIHQEDSAESWYNTDIQLHTKFLNASTIKSLPKGPETSHTKSGGVHSSTKYGEKGRRDVKGYRNTEEENRKRVIERAQEVCWRYNLKDIGCRGCGRQHRCDTKGCTSTEPAYSHHSSSK
jgi:hypothetical protein